MMTVEARGDSPGFVGVVVITEVMISVVDGVVVGAVTVDCTLEEGAGELLLLLLLVVAGFCDDDAGGLSDEGGNDTGLEVGAAWVVGGGVAEEAGSVREG